MDTRTVISGIPFEFSVVPENNFNDFEFGILQSANEIINAKFSFDEIIQWITKLKCKYEILIEPKSIFNILNWKVTENEILHDENKYFKVIAAKVEISNREVRTWSQPLVEPLQQGIIAFIVKKLMEFTIS